jgi:hypothetical protein
MKFAALLVQLNKRKLDAQLFILAHILRPLHARLQISHLNINVKMDWLLPFRAVKLKVEMALV